MAVLDFPVTTSVLSVLDEWFIPLIHPFLPLEQVQIVGRPDGEFWWNFREKSARAVMMGKAARAISGLRSAFILAGRGYVTECGTILRTVSEFRIEIGSLIDGETRKEGPTTAQKELVRQYFIPMAQSPEEFENSIKERYVARRDILAGFMRWAGKHSKPKEVERLRIITEYLLMGYDKYVHGGYVTAMELYTGENHSFMLGGHKDDFPREVSKRAVASKLHEFIVVLAGIAELVGNQELMRRIAITGLVLADSGELS
jgi:hypothetical protein